MNYLVTFDIPVENTRLRTKLGDKCMDYGLFRIQLSVFWGSLEKADLNDLMFECEELIDNSPADVRFFAVCDQCLEKSYVISNNSQIRTLHAKKLSDNIKLTTISHIDVGWVEKDKDSDKTSKSKTSKKSKNSKKSKTSEISKTSETSERSNKSTIPEKNQEYNKDRRDRRDIIDKKDKEGTEDNEETEDKGSKKKPSMKPNEIKELENEVEQNANDLFDLSDDKVWKEFQREFLEPSEIDNDDLNRDEISGGPAKEKAQEIGKEEGIKQEIGKEEGIKQEIGKEEENKQEIKKKKENKQEIKKEKGIKQEIGKEKENKQEIKKEEGIKQEIGKEKENKQEIKKEEGIKQKIGKEEGIKQEIGKEKENKQEIKKEEGIKQEIEKEEGIKQEIGKEKGIKQEIRKEEVKMRGKMQEKLNQKMAQDSVNNAIGYFFREILQDIIENYISDEKKYDNVYNEATIVSNSKEQITQNQVKFKESTDLLSTAGAKQLEDSDNFENEKGESIKREIGRNKEKRIKNESESESKRERGRGRESEKKNPIQEDKSKGNLWDIYLEGPDLGKILSIGDDLQRNESVPFFMTKELMNWLLTGEGNELMEDSESISMIEKEFINKVLSESEKIMPESEKIMSESEKIMPKSENIISEQERITSEQEKITSEQEKITPEQDKNKAKSEKYEYKKMNERLPEDTTNINKSDSMNVEETFVTLKDIMKNISLIEKKTGLKSKYHGFVDIDVLLV
ncbi:CRISPR-associated endonuclease Cas2 [Candidatus Harpocratesius sp.]